MKLYSKSLGKIVLLVLLVVGFSGPASAALITSFYGDDDGFGVGQTAGNLTNPLTSNQEAGEAPLTDQRLIGTGFAAPAFAPAGSFEAFVIPGGDTILSASLTLRTGSFDSGPNPVNGPNMIFLDGMLVDSSFINSFSTVNGNQIQTLTFALPASFFPLLADGAVSLSGTRISEASGSQSFQVDFLRLDITTQAAPEPATLLLLGSGLAAIGLFGRKRVRN